MRASQALALMLSCLLTVANANEGSIILANCLSKNGVTQEELKLASYNQLMDSSDNFKCAAKCVLQELDFIDDQGRLQANDIIKRYSDPFIKNAVIKSLINCINIRGINTCDTAYKTLLCLEKNIW